MEDGEAESLELYGLFKELTLTEVKKTYARLGVSFDSFDGEAFYNDKMQPVLDELKRKNLLTISEGAGVVDLSEFNMPPCLLVKADGATLYATRDLAAAVYRKTTYDFEKCLYVVAYQQNLHFKQVFKVLELMGKQWAPLCVHVPFGMVSLEDGAMSTRKGNVVLLEDVLDKAAEKSLEIIEQKSPYLADKAATAESVGVGAVVFSGLYNNRIKDMVFSYDRVLSFDGETGPYVQYTNARCISLLIRSGALPKDGAHGLAAEADVEGGLLDEESEDVVALLEAFPEIIRTAAEKYEPSYIARYLADLCKAYNRFYIARRIIGEPTGIMHARLALTEATHIVLEEGLRLLGIAAPKEM
jgi:arginyl-tRNA synthetase